MKFGDPQDYFIELADDGACRVFSAAAPTLQCKFSGASAQKGPKLYTVSKAGVLLYVGIATRTMSARLRHGLIAKGVGGYHGYKWKGVRERLALAVWTVSFDGEAKPLQELETVEAEVVFLCRTKGQWPAQQHEIHFHVSRDIHRDAATRIFNHASANSSGSQ